MSVYGKGAKGKADRLFSQIIRARDQHCRICGRGDNLQCAHIVSRRYSHTRCDLTNAVALCARHHMEIDGDPYAKVVFATELLGEDGYRELRERALGRSKVDWSAVYAGLLEVAKELGVS